MGLSQQVMWSKPGKRIGVVDKDYYQPRKILVSARVAPLRALLISAMTLLTNVDRAPVPLEPIC